MSETRTVSCAVCGRTVPEPAPITWSVATGSRGVTRTCDTCTRENVRSIEGKLDEEWW